MWENAGRVPSLRLPDRIAAGTGRRFDWMILLPVLATCAFFAAGDQNFGFDDPGMLDPFMFLGYFWHYPEHLPYFERDYKGSRLPWVLPGFVAHWLLPEAAASYLLHGVTLGAGGVALFLLLRDTLKDRSIAAVVAVAWVSLTNAHGVGGWNYQALAGASYYLLSCWLVVRAASTTSRRYPILAGIVLACAFYTHVLFALFAPLVAALYLTALPADSRGVRRVGGDAALGMAGGVLLTAILAGINRGTGGVWLFFMNDLQHSLQISVPGNNFWWSDAGRWLPRATHLVIPLSSFVGGLVALVRRRAMDDRFGTLFIVQGWIGLGIYAYFQLVRRQTMLDPNYFAFALYCLAFPAIGAILQHTRQSSLQRGAWLTIVSAALIPGALLFAMPALPILIARSTAFASAWPLIVLPLAAGVAGLAVVSMLPRSFAILAFAAWFSVLNAWVTTSHPYGIGTPGIQRSMLELIREADRMTAGLDPSVGQIKYWFRSETIETTQGAVNLAHVFDSYVSTRGWMGNLLAGRSPALALEEIEPSHLEGVACLGILSSVGMHDQLRADLATHLARVNVRLDVVAERRFQRPDLAFALTVAKPSRVDEGNPAQGAPPGRPPAASSTDSVLLHSGIWRCAG